MTISITIPNEPTAIAAAIVFFNALQGKVVHAGPVSELRSSSPPVSGALVDEGDEIPENGTSTGAAAATGSAKLDAKGVPFDANFCANAADPFYGSGQRAGQWKKRKGVADEAYDAWYDERLQDLAPAGTVTVNTGDEGGQPLANTAGAFGAAAATTGAKVPTNAGEFMAWVSEKQAAQRLTQPDIAAAYQFAGLQIADLFGADAAVVARNVSSLYSILSQTAGA
jgi:hypothetical protein